MAASGHPRPPDPDDLRRLASAEDGGDADRDRESPLPPRRWRPQSDALRQWRRRLGGQEPDRRL